MSNEIKPVAIARIHSASSEGTQSYVFDRLRNGEDFLSLGEGDHPLYDQSAIDRLKAERDGWIEQHHRDSVQLRALCSERDVAWLQCKELAAQLAECKADAERCRAASTKMGLDLSDALSRLDSDKQLIARLSDESLRLNFIETEWFFADPAKRARIATSPCWVSGEHTSLRSAIDAARKES